MDNISEQKGSADRIINYRLTFAL